MVAVALSDVDVIHAWLDPEFWPPPGLGCSRCHERPPIVVGLSFGALCDECLLRCFPGWSFERVAEWLVRQKQTCLRQEARREASAARKRGDGGEAWHRYKREFDPIEWWD